MRKPRYMSQRVQRERAEAARRAEFEMQARMKRELEEKHNLIGHPKADLLFKIACSHGHGWGGTKIEAQYSMLADLLKP